MTDPISSDRSSAVIGFRAQLEVTQVLLSNIRAAGASLPEDEDTWPGDEPDYTMTTQQPQKETR